nr:unnamed protein product [Naegleria fowleri]
MPNQQSMDTLKKKNHTTSSNKKKNELAAVSKNRQPRKLRKQLDILDFKKNYFELDLKSTSGDDHVPSAPLEVPLLKFDILSTSIHSSLDKEKAKSLMKRFYCPKRMESSEPTTTTSSSSLISSVVDGCPDQEISQKKKRKLNQTEEMHSSLDQMNSNSSTPPLRSECNYKVRGEQSRCGVSSSKCLDKMTCSRGHDSSNQECPLLPFMSQQVSLTEYLSIIKRLSHVPDMQETNQPSIQVPSTNENHDDSFALLSPFTSLQEQQPPSSTFDLFPNTSQQMQPQPLPQLQQPFRVHPLNQVQQWYAGEVDVTNNNNTSSSSACSVHSFSHHKNLSELELYNINNHHSNNNNFMIHEGNCGWNNQTLMNTFPIISNTSMANNSSTYKVSFVQPDRATDTQIQESTPPTHEHLLIQNNQNLFPTFLISGHLSCSSDTTIDASSLSSTLDVNAMLKQVLVQLLMEAITANGNSNEATPSSVSFDHSMHDHSSYLNLSDDANWTPVDSDQSSSPNISGNVHSDPSLGDFIGDDQIM